VENLTNDVVLDGIVGLLPPSARKAIVACCRRGYGDARDLRGILAQAKRAKAPARVVAAALGYLPDAHRPSHYVDVLAGDEFALGLLPKGAAVRAAFALSRAVHPEGGSFTAE
jgi:hypothetical protein